VITPQAAFLAFLISGILVLVLSLMLTRMHWRADLTPYGRGTELLHITPRSTLRMLRFVPFEVSASWACFSWRARQHSWSASSSAHLLPEPDPELG
jgi:hypothetical protein